jgi:hypothetical protein
MNTNTKIIMLLALALAVILLLRKKAKLDTSTVAFRLQWADWSAQKFTFSHPALGKHNIVAPMATEGAYHQLANTDELQLGWNRVPGNKVVVTLLHKVGSVFSEVYVLDLDGQTAEYYSELNGVTVTA